MGFFISTMVFLLLGYLKPFKLFQSFQRFRSFRTRGSFVISWRPFFGLDQASMSAVAIGMILGSPATTDGDGRGLVKFQNMRRDISDGVRAVAERQVFRACAAAVRHAL